MLSLMCTQWKALFNDVYNKIKIENLNIKMKERRCKNDAIEKTKRASVESKKTITK